MKTKLFILILFLILIYNAFGQVDSTKSKKNGCSLVINSVEAQIGDAEKAAWGFQVINNSDKIEKSFSLSIIPKWFINNDVLLRFELGMTSINFSNNQDTKDNVNHTITNQSLKQKIYRYIPGLQWNFLKKKNIGIYCGVTAAYYSYKDINYTYYSEVRQMPTDTLTFIANTEIIYKGGFALGIGTFAGLNLQIKKHVSVGTEVSYSLLYYKLGGAFQPISTYQSVPNPQLTLPTAPGSSSYNGFQFSKIMPSLNISIWF